MVYLHQSVAPHKIQQYWSETVQAAVGDAAEESAYQVQQLVFLFVKQDLFQRKLMHSLILEPYFTLYLFYLILWNTYLVYLPTYIH
jgi:hypothetical protein